MKGISLPINTIVIISIVLLVLLVVAAFFSTNVVDQMSEADALRIWNEGCMKYCNSCENFIAANCDARNSDKEAYANCRTEPDIAEFAEACKTLGYISSEGNVDDCFITCGNCPTGCTNPS